LPSPPSTLFPYTTLFRSPLTPVYVQGFWSAPQQEGDDLVVNAEFGPLGAAPTKVTLKFSFNQQEQITRVEQQAQMAQPLPQSEKDRKSTRLNSSHEWISY